MIVYLGKALSITETLEIIVKNVSDNVKWLATSYMHTNDRVNYFNRHTPRISNNIYSINLLGTPSAFTIQNGCDVWFDENLVWAYDSEFYGRMAKKFGIPKIVDEVTMVNYLWEGQITNMIADNELRRKEEEYVLRKVQNA